MSPFQILRYLCSFAIAIYGVCILLSSPNIADEPMRESMWGTSQLHYEVLSRPASKHGDIKPRTSAPQVVRPVKPYAYGWFGATPSKHWYRQFGHQNSYTQFSLR